MENIIKLHFYSEKQKYSNDKQWFKDFMDYIDKVSLLNSDLFVEHNIYKEMKINYDLYNNIIHIEDFLKYCNLDDIGAEIPENFTNTDIISKNIKILEGIEFSRPFMFKVLAVNPEATTRKEQEYFNRVRDFVVSQIIQEIKQLTINNLMAQKGELTEEDLANIEEQFKNIDAIAPDEVKRYMEREYQDIAEVAASQLLEYLQKELNLKYKINSGFKHALKAAVEVYRVYTENNEVFVDVVNPLNFDFDRSNNNTFIHLANWAVYEMPMSINDIIVKFPELSKQEIEEAVSSNIDTFYSEENIYANIPVKHYVWKSTRKIGFLTYIDVNTGNVFEKIVDENYELQPEYGDIDIVWKRIPEVYEGYKIAGKIYAKMGRVQYIRDIDNINNVYLPYIGAIYDGDNTKFLSIVGRMKPYQYLYNIVLTRLKYLMSSDKGKILMMNIGLIPRSQKIDVKTWLKYATMFNIAFYNPHEEGDKIIDINTSTKVLDMSLVSDIEKYIKLAEYIERLARFNIGITDQMLGQIGQYETATNTQRAITQTSLIIEPYFSLHYYVVQEMLNYLLNLARFAYSSMKQKKISYVTDDLTRKFIEINDEVLTNNIFGVFVVSDYKLEDIRQNIIALSHAALQNNKARFSDIIKLLKVNNIEEMEEILKAAEKEIEQYTIQLQQQEAQMKEELLERQKAIELEKIDRKGQWDLEIAKLEAEMKLKQQAILAAGFAEDKDIDKDKILDVFEYAKKELELEKKEQELDIEKKKIELEKSKDKNKK